MFRFKKKYTKEDIAKKVKYDFLENGAGIFRKYGVEKVFLFGSIFETSVKDETKVAILAIPLSKEEFWTFRQEIGELIGHSVDVYVQNDAPFFVEDIQKKGIPIFKSDQQTRQGIN